MVLLADIQPLSIAKINIFHRQPRFYRQIYHRVKVHASIRGPCTNYDLLIRCVTAPVSINSNFVLHILTLTGNA